MGRYDKTTNYMQLKIVQPTFFQQCLCLEKFNTDSQSFISQEENWPSDTETLISHYLGGLWAVSEKDIRAEHTVH